MYVVVCWFVYGVAFGKGVEGVCLVGERVVMID